MARTHRRGFRRNEEIFLLDTRGRMVENLYYSRDGKTFQTLFAATQEIAGDLQRIRATTFPPDNTRTLFDFQLAGTVLIFRTKQVFVEDQGCDWNGVSLSPVPKRWPCFIFSQARRLFYISSGFGPYHNLEGFRLFVGQQGYNMSEITIKNVVAHHHTQTIELETTKGVLLAPAPERPTPATWLGQVLGRQNLADFTISETASCVTVTKKAKAA